MKNYIKNILYIFCLGLMTFSLGCDGNFEEINTDPNAVTSDRFNPAYLLTTAQVQTALASEHVGGNMYYCEAFVQHFASLSNVGIFNWHGDKYVLHQGNNDQLWESTYKIDKLVMDVIQATKDNPEYQNLYNMALIWRSLIFHRLTDLYGDAPFSEAGLGYYEGIYKPVYDAQESIYDQMLNQLDAAVNNLDGSKDNFAAFDVAYEGDINKWKRMGNSLMLRLAMRLSKADPAKAEQWVKKAFAKDLMQDNADNLAIRGTDPNGTVEDLTNKASLMFSRSATGQISATFFDYLDERNDPRLQHMVAVYTDPYDATTKNDDPEIQKGLPNGLDRFSLVDDPSYVADHPAQENQYSTLDRDVYGKLDGYRMLLTYAEVQLLLAEAALRGWISGDAKTYFENGVKGDMKNVASYEPTAIITDAEIATYLAENPYVGDGDMEKALEQINSQYWVATFMNGYEAFANYRRSGYPALVPINYLDNETGGLRPGRLIYPENEPVLNTANYNAAVSRQGTDNFITHVWWDK
ncbi:SusD/RagB family nutrient-binding outer membrane lipoprotein [Membranihabitans marinus]|uniref:SusD/RagB family nutrient-binding outer membrane lipoprotein n=1 Tax=Membranihabitans marinus TaxID=1227546 RepID=UPI001F384E0F|nr:SusD/RagB family nutrient-binding outer membrane lipoprotein [Membranihabitans marinus]